MKKTKRCLALLLCVLLTVGTLALPAAAAGGVCATYSDHKWVIDSPVIGQYCPWTNGAEHTWQHCSVCGLEFQIITRTNGTPVYDDTGRQHNWIDHQSVPSACPNNPWRTQICSLCGTVIFVSGSGEHNWSDWQSDNASGPCGGIETRTCACGAKETRNTGSGHKWQTVSQTAATCTKAGSITKQCSVCYEQETTTTPALGHDYNYNSYWYDDTHHWNQCSRCYQIQNPTSHTPDSSGICTVCGAKVNLPAAPSTPTPPPSGPDPSTCHHNYVVSGQANVGSIKLHVEKCTICGKEIEVYCSGKTRALPRTYCTEPLMCECGNQIEAARASHYSGGWTATDTTHMRVCKIPGCQYVSPAEPHNMVTTNGVSQCSVCGYIDPASQNTHTHVWGVWTSNGASSHSHSCTVPGCSATETSSHNFGAANCKGEAVCADCGATAAGQPAGAHSGGTEIRDAKAATTEAEGYTGDTYCLGCGQKISSGTSIPVLPSSHTHSYASTWSKDGTHHWKDCSCGDKKDYAEHTFKDGKCTVCGEADPNYEAPQDHVHSWNSGWTTSATEHWHTCSGCAETADRGEHVVITEGSVQKCGVCGITLGEIKELEKDEQKPDTQEPDTQKPDTQKPETQEPETPKPSTKEEFAEEAVKQFNDVVKEDAFYAAPVGWAVQNSITNGTSEENKTFSPDKTCTQAEILTMLYRAARIAEDPDFKPDGSDMKAAQAWAAENGIIGADFDPNAACTRAIAVSFMWKAADCPEAEGSVTFNDVTGDFEQAVAWAQAKGITNGTNLEKGLFSPDKTCNRGEIVTFLYRDQVEPLA